MARTGNAIAVLLLLLTQSTVNAITISRTFDRWNVPTTPVTFNVTNESYKIFGGLIRAVVHEEAGSGEFWNRPHLPEQEWHGEPPHWIVIILLGRGNERTQIALRGDNLYFVGFTSKSVGWYELKPQNGQRRVIPNSVLLSFDGSYHELVGGKSKLLTLEVGKEALLDAIGILYNYSMGNISELELKKAIASIILMICEAARLIPIRNRISSNWEGGITITKDHAKYIVTWGKMSFLLMCKAYGAEWTNRDANELYVDMKLKDHHEVLDIVDIILWPRGFNPIRLDISCM